LGDPSGTLVLVTLEIDHAIVALVAAAAAPPLMLQSLYRPEMRLWLEQDFGTARVNSSRVREVDSVEQGDVGVSF